MSTNRRVFLQRLAQSTGALVLLPLVSRCGGDSTAASEATGGGEVAAAVHPPMRPDPMAIPTTKPADWDAIAFNLARGNAGAIPESYHASINGPDGVDKHLGKHLPYLPEVDGSLVPAGFIALMWGDPSLGHTMHPNAPRTEENPDGHWYNWIRVRKAEAGEAEELQSGYSNWPATEAGDEGRYVAFEGSDPAENSGKNTVYLAALPEDVGPGDTIRVHAHCLTHGEWVDFLTLPG